MDQPPAGWYPDPEYPGHQRYWDGTSWTEHRAPDAQPPGAEAPVHMGPTQQSWFARHKALGITGIVVGAFILLFVILGVIGLMLPATDTTNAGRSPEPSAEPTTSPQPTESPTATESASATTTSPPPSPAPKPAKPKPPALTGFGATVEAWEDVRGKSNPKYAEGAVYGPEVRPGVHQYFAVFPDPRVTFYSRGFPEGTPLDLAKRLVLDDFPRDARITVVDDDEAACEIVLIESKTVKRVVDSLAIAAFFSEQDPDDMDRTALNRSDVSDATLMSHYEGRISDLGMC